MWERKELLAIGGLVALASLALGQEQPNILLILADDMGYNDIGYHNPFVLTPNLDELARSGIILEHNYAQPICTPSRSSLMSGMYAYLVGRQGTPIPHKQPSGLTLDRKLMPEYMKDKGYATHMIGKWHLGFCKEEYLPTNRGFDSHYGYWGGSEDYYTKWYRHGYDFRDQMELDLVANNTFSEDLYEERFVKILDKHVVNNSSKPFFIFMSHQAVHTPLAPPQEYLDLYAGVEDEARRKLLATSTVLDEKVGIMVQNLKDRGLYENTLVVFISDNGGNPIIGAGGNNWPLRGFKGFIWEGGVRVPGFVHSPLLKNAGYTSENLFHISDWLPTFYHLAGATPEEIQGLSNGEKASHSNNVEDSSIDNNVDNDRAVDIIHLYDLEVDPEERNDIKFEQDKNQSLIETYLREELPHVVQLMDARMEELKLGMVPADNADEIDGGNEGGIWSTGWC